jgi:hypothetical protein
VNQKRFVAESNLILGSAGIGGTGERERSAFPPFDFAQGGLSNHEHPHTHYSMIGSVAGYE